MSVMLSRSAFTLIELLVVIAIIATLLALLMPAISTNMALARATQCMSNQRQLGVALYAYAEDWGDRIPPSWSRLGSEGFQRAWTVRLRNYLGRSTLPTWRDGQLPPGVFRCPGSTGVVKNDGDAHFGMNYAAQQWNGGTSWYQGIQLGALRQPSSAFVITDSRSRDVWQRDGTTAKPDFRHRGSVNLLFYDGHVERRERLRISSSIYQLPWKPW